MAVAAVALLASGAAAASTTTRQLPGSEQSVACLTARYCVAVGSVQPSATRIYGTVVSLVNGAVSHESVLKASDGILSVSCVGPAGCWAIGQTRDGRAYLVQTGSTGRPVREHVVSVPVGDHLNSIACASMTSCVAVGEDVFDNPPVIVVGQWNGRSLQLTTATVSSTFTTFSLTGVSCWRSGCEAVGFGIVGKGNGSAVVAIRNGKPGTVHVVKGSVSLLAVSCVSATLCYADGSGYAPMPGEVLVIRNGVPGHVRQAGRSLLSIACAGSRCTAVGLASSGSHGKQEGEIVALSGGVTVGKPVLIAASSAFTGVARAGAGYVAVGTPSHGSGTVAVSG